MIYTFKDFHNFLEQPTSYGFFQYADEKYKELKCYHEIFIDKKNGDIRILQAPCKKLKWLQRRILPFFKNGEISSCACAYRENYNISTNALPHVGQKMLVKLDIENFFGSITFSQVFHAIDLAIASSPHIGYGHNHNLNPQNYNSELSWYFSKICTLNGTLPQGAPTSPILSNLVFFPLDNIINSYCQKRKISYTRYSDDMTFSGEFSPIALISFVRKFLSKNGFKLNEDKVVISGFGQKHIVTGICVNEKLQAERSYRRKIRQEMYFVCKYGISDYYDLRTQISKLQSLLGQITFVLQLDPQNSEFIQYKKDCLHMLSLIPYLL